MESGFMASLRPTKGATHKSPSKSARDRQSTSPATRSSSPTNAARSNSPRSNSPSAPTASRSRRTAPPSSRDTHGPSRCSSSSGSCKGSDCSPTKGRQKMKSCTENHGIRPPPPEQYLTPLQQKEVCIRHLRSKLQETIGALQNRDCEIDELRERLFQMQEDWVEEECHRVEAQLALKEARHEIYALRQAMEGVRGRLGEPGDSNFQNHKLESLLLMSQSGPVEAGVRGEVRVRGDVGVRGEVNDGEERGAYRPRTGGSAPASVSGESPGGGLPRASPGGGGGSCSCDGSPARSLTRSSTYTKLTEAALAQSFPQHFGSMSAQGTQDSGFCGADNAPPTRAELLLEAACLSEETASLLSAYTQTFASLPPSLPHSLTHNLPPPYQQPHTLPHTLPYSQTLPHSFPRSHPSHAPFHALPHSSTCEGLCGGDYAPLAHPYRCSLPPLSCMSHPCLSHHLFLHPLREAGIQTESCPIPASGGSDLDTIAEARTFRSQACSPTSTWTSDDGEELDSAHSLTTVMTTATEPLPAAAVRPGQVLPRSATVACSIEGPEAVSVGEKEKEEEKGETEMREKEKSGLGLKEDTDLPEEKANKPEELNTVCSDLQQDDMDLTTWTTELEVEDLSCSALSLDEPMTSQMQTNQSETSQPQTTQSERSQPQRNQSEMSQPQPDQSETSQPQRNQSETSQPQMTQSETSQPQRNQSEMSQPQTDQSETRQTQTNQSETSPQQTDQSETRQPQTNQSETSQPQTDQSETNQPQTNQPQMNQPQRSSSPLLGELFNPAVGEIDGDEEGPEAVPEAGAEAGVAEGSESSGPIERSYWSRHFLVDLLAVAIPVVPTVAWLCRGPVRDAQPIYHFGSLLRGCCTVALHSLRRGGGLRHYPAGGGMGGGGNM
ncbi:uncharacterized protein snphb [Periophthalmus magnuspinnatus]|uniref:uncharacterized protein snphb n=1 Tax=Periophthalmus magnuspinnatus TaxID=409849 RepID=UPI0024373836|nr:uncharacterized protein snphb [Periophthalmus magnuspinnatus]